MNGPGLVKGISVASLGNPDKDGYLTKRGGNIKTWKKRWCVLKDGSIFYFKGPKDLSPKGSMDLERSSRATETTLTKKKYAFQVQTAQRTFVITAESESNKREWMAAINSSVSSLQEVARENGATPRGTSEMQISEASNSSSAGEKGEAAAKERSAQSPKEESRAKSVARAGVSDVPARVRLSQAKGCIPFLQEDESKVMESRVLEFWQIWTESIPAINQLSIDTAIEFHVCTSASMEKLTWRMAGPQNSFIQQMVDFFGNVGAPESEIDRLNDVGALINPIMIGSWIDMSSRGGMDGGWYFPVENTLNLALEAADAGEPTTKVKDWGLRHGINKVYSVGRDMGAAPPRQTELRIKLPGATLQDQLQQALDAFESFGFPNMPTEAVNVIKKSSATPLCLSIVTSSEGFVRLGVLQPNPTTDDVSALCSLLGANKGNLATFEGALGSDGPAYAEYQYLMQGFGYGVYKEGFDIIFHYFVGEERGADE